MPKVSVRNARRDAIDGLKKAQKEGMPEDVAKDGETSAQKLHDKYMKKNRRYVCRKRERDTHRIK